MSGRHVVVTLHPVYFPDTLPFRTLTFASDSDTVKIGRSSKCEAKNLIPAHNNGWFDSRVMSRHHARLGVSLRDKKVYLRDCGSMHGTYINDKKIPVGQDTAIRSGDILTFGNEVTRGSETFPPLRVRCECQWFDNREENPTTNSKRTPVKRATNCFSVPEDDDDVVEIVHDSAPKKPASHTVYTVPDSDDDSGSNSDSDSRPGEHSSPVTSPLRNDAATNVADTKVGQIKTSDNNDLDGREGSQQSPILLDGDQPLVTPRMTPPPATSAPGAFPSTQDDAPDHIPDGDSDSESMQVSLAGDGSEDSDPWDDEEQQLSFEDDSEPHASGESDVDEPNKDDASVGFTSESASVPYELPYAETEGDLEVGDSDSAHLNTQPENGNAHQAPKDAYAADAAASNSTTSNEPPTFEAQSRSFDLPQNSTRIGVMSYNPVPYQGNWAANSRNNPIPSPSYKHMEKILNPNLPSYSCTSFSPSFGEWTGPSGLNHASQVSLGTFASASPANNLNSYMSYADMSFAFNQQRLSAQNAGSSNCATLPSPADLANHCPDDRLDRQCSKPVDSRNDPAESSLPANVESSDQSANNDMTKSKIDPENQNEKPSTGPTAATTRVSIADIVDESTSEVHYSGQRNSLKRKAADMESQPAEFGGFSLPESFGDAQMAAVCSDAASSLPDAQPQTPMKVFDNSASQITDIPAITELEKPRPVAPEASEGEPRRKRVKVTNGSRRSSFAGYAVSALIGAVVGGIGTVAALASLPPDFFGVQT